MLSLRSFSGACAQQYTFSAVLSQSRLTHHSLTCNRFTSKLTSTSTHTGSLIWRLARFLSSRVADSNVKSEPMKLSNASMKKKLFLVYKLPNELATPTDLSGKGRPTVFERLKQIGLHLRASGAYQNIGSETENPTVSTENGSYVDSYYPAGLLDYRSEGLMFITNDGKISNWLDGGNIIVPEVLEGCYSIRKYLHSGSTVNLPKAYITHLRQPIPEHLLHSLMKGIVYEGKPYPPVVVQPMFDESLLNNEGGNRKKNIKRFQYRVVVPTGQPSVSIVRKVLTYLGYPPVRFVRMSYGPFVLGTLPPGSALEIKIPSWLRKCSDESAEKSNFVSPLPSRNLLPSGPLDETEKHVESVLFGELRKQATTQSLGKEEIIFNPQKRLTLNEKVSLGNQKTSRNVSDARKKPVHRNAQRKPKPTGFSV